MATDKDYLPSIPGITNKSSAATRLAIKNGIGKDNAMHNDYIKQILLDMSFEQIENELKGKKKGGKIKTKSKYSKGGGVRPAKYKI